MTFISIIIVNKDCSLKSLKVKNYNEEELYKKCGFKKSDNFLKHTKWNAKIKGETYQVTMYGKLSGKANTENKYDFPPPIDNELFFGNCVLVCKIKLEDEYVLCNLTIELWDIIYEKLFGGFEDLSATSKMDELEEDELEGIDNKYKTKQGYLKDGFVVDSSDVNSSSDLSVYLSKEKENSELESEDYLTDSSSDTDN
jgi:hypothetical protein